MKYALMTAALLIVCPAAAHADWWKPVNADPWQWEINHALRVGNDNDMGTGETAWDGTRPPASNPKVYDIDGFENTARTVGQLHSMGHKVICYIEAGETPTWRPDYREFPRETIGRKVGHWPGEFYIDIRDQRAVDIIKKRVKMCADKGFDAIEPDLDTSYAERPGSGFPLTKADALTFMRTLSDYAHSLGVAMFAKNPDSTGDSFANDLYDMIDGIVTEECNMWNTCGALKRYEGHKAVFNAEYEGNVANFCPKDIERGWAGAKFEWDLDGPRKGCK